MRAMGIPPGRPLPKHYGPMLDEAFSVYDAVVDPSVICEDISVLEFARIYSGEGENDPDTPLEHIFPRADRVALFALTLGGAISGEIERLFDENEAAIAYVLDVVASEAADGAVKWIECRFQERGSRSGDSAVLSYSPGYCGWHISSQKKLFERLEPGRIGISLSSSFLMQPLKSVSGVLVSGERDIHRFNNIFPFCAQCRDKTCRKRIAGLFREQQKSANHGTRGRRCPQSRVTS